MKGNFVVCRNEVVVEGVSIGEFSAAEVILDRDSLIATATIELPLYTISMQKDGTPPGQDVPLTRRSRMGVEMGELKCGAQIVVWAWYESPGTMADFAKQIVFSGYIRKVEGGFPSVLKCEDMGFPLRFGDVNKSWNPGATLVKNIESILPIAHEAFSKYREKQGFNDNWTRVTIVGDEIADAPYRMEPWKEISPFDALQRTVSDYGLSGLVDDSGRLYIGAMENAPTHKTVELDTRFNVLECDVDIEDAMFVNYNVKLTARTVGGQVIEAEYGDPDGEPLPKRMMPANTQQGLNQMALAIYNKLVGGVNSGSISMLLYPRVDLFDFVTLNHTLFPELSGDYTVIGLTRKLGEGGFRQELTVTDKKYTTIQ